MSAEEPRATTPRDLAPHEPESRSFNERWSYHLLLDDGSQLVINFQLARLGGFREPTAGVELSAMGFGGRDYFLAREYPVATRFRYDPRVHRLEVHPDIYFEGAPPRSHRLRLSTEKDGVSYDLDLVFHDMDPGMTLGDGRFAIGSETIGMYIHIPFARVSGKVQIGGTRRDVRGTGYMDHTFQTNYGPRLIQAAYRIVRHDGAGYEVGYYLEPQGGTVSTPIGFGVRHDRRGRSVLLPVALDILNVRPSLRLDVPGQLRVRFDDGTETVLTRQRDRQSVSALHELSGLVRAAARRLLGGEIFYFRGRGQVGSGEAAGYDFLIVR